MLKSPNEKQTGKVSYLSYFSVSCVALDGCLDLAEVQSA